jgi:ribonucleoside-diphosphate reductase alpha chain
VKLPEQYPAYGYILKSEGKKWYVHVAFKDKACTRPFAIFVNTNAREDNVVSFNALEKLEDLANAQGLNNGLVEEVKRKYAYQKNPVKICRMLGFLLRHNVRIYKIVMALDEVEEAHPGTFVYRIKKFLAQFVRSVDEPSICPNCNEKSLMFTEGCYLCTNCGHTRC